MGHIFASVIFVKFVVYPVKVVLVGGCAIGFEVFPIKFSVSGGFAHCAIDMSSNAFASQSIPDSVRVVGPVRAVVEKLWDEGGRGVRRVKGIPGSHNLLHK